MLDKNGKPVLIDPSCNEDHNDNDCNVFKNEFSQRYFEYKCGCTKVHSALSRPVKGQRRKNIANGIDMNDPFIKGLYEDDF